MDAVVFIHRDNHSSDIDKKLPLVEKSTGEVYFKELEDVTPKVVFESIHKRLGNISTIAYYRYNIRDRY